MFSVPQVRQYGEIDAKEYVPGAEVLVKKKIAQEPEPKPDDVSDSDSGSWVDISDDEISEIDIDADSEKDSYESEGEEESSDEEDHDESNIESEDVDTPVKKPLDKVKPKTKLERKKEKMEKAKKSNVNKEEIVQHRKELAEEISCTRILTDEDFQRIENAQAKKMKTGFKALQLGKKRKHNVALEQEEAKGELVNISDIENIYKRKKHDKASRLESVLKGREGREKWGYKKNRTNPHASTTNQEKKKDKNFMMVRHKVRGKIKRSFKDKQIALRNHLVKQRKMK